jgi:hypothetical protein
MSACVLIGFRDTFIHPSLIIRGKVPAGFAWREAWVMYGFERSRPLAAHGRAEPRFESPPAGMAGSSHSHSPLLPGPLVLSAARALRDRLLQHALRNAGTCVDRVLLSVPGVAPLLKAKFLGWILYLTGRRLDDMSSGRIATRNTSKLTTLIKWWREAIKLRSKA